VLGLRRTILRNDPFEVVSVLEQRFAATITQAEPTLVVEVVRSSLGTLSAYLWLLSTVFDYTVLLEALKVCLEAYSLTIYAVPCLALSAESVQPRLVVAVIAPPDL